MYDIRFCKADEIKKIQHFINRHWKKGHVLARNEELLRWQHFNVKKNHCNFVVAYDHNTDDFLAILGIIPTWHYDSELFSEKDFWLAIWKVNEKQCIKQGLGINLLSFLKKKYNPNSIAAIGISDLAKKIYRIFGYQVGKLTQYYFLNPHVSIYKIAKIHAPNSKSYPRSQFSITIIADPRTTKELNSNMRPKKTIEYLCNRYIKHPVYTYVFYGIYLSEKLKAIFVIRKVAINGANCLRIVDIVGNIGKINSLESEFERLLIENNAEYLDCLNYGIDETTFHNMGFSTRAAEVIVPNYFEPFEKQNVDVDFAYKTKCENYVIFKGDSDQDRPNI
jgi:hypothetical protein